MAYSTQEVTDRWKTGDITWYGDYIDDKSCGTGAYGLPEKEVEENDSGELSGNQPVLGCTPDNSSRSPFSATTWPRWLR